ncbi:MAG: polymer-forming cytoskeletal protein [Spirochaetaceae bacterium]|jgi:cytoskeletal protein CcmA (bactofilin family)|nr:polymer-forming cytoskeletal protein [Spirochaetaceae bacterium]
MAAQHTDDITINTLIGPGSSVTGDLRIAGFVRIDGDIVGSLETTGRVIIGEKARIKANIRALSVTVGGIVEGDIVAPEGIVIYSTGMVIGDVITKKLRVDDEVVLHGACISIKDEDAFDKARTKWQDMKAIRTKTFY